MSVNGIQPSLEVKASQTKTKLDLKKQRLDYVAAERERRRFIELPTSYGMPDLLKPVQYVSDEERIRIENENLKNFIENKMFFEKDGVRRRIKMIPEALRFVADLFYQRTKFAILWKPRGGGGSLAASLVIWLTMVYQKKSWMDMGGSAKQAKAVYNYTKEFWKCFPGLEQRLLAHEPQQSSTKLVTGTELICVACSEKAVRGEHKPGFCGDESSALPGTMVMGDMLWRPVETFKNSELVMNGAGEFLKNRHSWSRDYDGWATSIVVYGFPWPLKLTADHLVKKDSGWTHANCVKEGDWIVIPRPVQGEGITVLEMDEWSKGRSQKVVSKKKIEMNREFYRWLGYWVGDGSYVTNGHTDKWGCWEIKMTTHIDDKINADDFSLLTEKVFGKKTNVNKKPKENAVDVRMSSKGMWNFISVLGKGTERRIPSSWLSGASDECMMEFLIGYLRADGFLAKSDYAEVRLNTISPGLMAAAQYASWRIGLNPYISCLKRSRYGKKNKDAYELRWSGAGAKIIADRVWGKKWDSSNGSTKWKYDEIDKNIKVRVKRVDRFQYKGPVWDIEMPGPAYSFMAGGVTVHNCQKDEGTSIKFEAAMQGMFSEDDPIAMLTSTFHHPYGFFQEYWDFADDKGFKQYKWDIFDTMKRCNRGMEYATKKDPLALKYCQNNCPLTEKKKVYDDDGNVTEIIYEECAGKARHTDGYASFDNILNAKKNNSSGQTWKTEFCCKRPRARGELYKGDYLEDALFDEVDIMDEGLRAGGLDWGLMTQAFLTIAAQTPEGACVPHGKSFEGESATEIGDYILRQYEEYGRFTVYADAEEAYGNQQLELMGIEVVPVHFGKWKTWGVNNLMRWLEFKRLKILNDGDLKSVLMPQMRQMHKNILGKIVKKDDHGPDSLMCAMLPFDFLEMCGNVMKGGLREKGERSPDEPEVTVM